MAYALSLLVAAFLSFFASIGIGVQPTTSEPQVSSQIEVVASSVQTPEQLATTLPQDSAEPQCSLEVVTDRGMKQFHPDDIQPIVLISSGGFVTVTWASNNASSATFQSGPDSVPAATSGTRKFDSITKETVYAYTFEGPKGSVVCAFTARPFSITPDEKTLTSVSPTPTVTGAAAGFDAISFEINKQAYTDHVFISKPAPVLNGRWSIPVTSPVPDGVYSIEFYGYGGSNKTYLQSSDITITSAGLGELSLGLAVQPQNKIIPGNTTVPFTVFKLTNTGKGLSTITRFVVSAYGDAPHTIIDGTAIQDDSGSCNGFNGGDNVSPFDHSDSIWVYCSITLKPGETRTFTLSGHFKKNTAAYAGKTISIAISGVFADGTYQTKQFPVYGAEHTVAAQ